MRAQLSEQFDPSDAWRTAEAFLRQHGRTPHGEPLSAELVQLLMVGVWAGCRLGLVDRDLALAVAALGNAQGGIVFDSLRRGFASEFGEPMQQLVHDVLYGRGFTNAWTELVPPEAEAGPEGEPLSGANVIAAAQELLRELQQRGRDGDPPEAQR